MKRDIITKIQTTYTPDGSGGYTEETIELGSFDVKLGVSNNVQEATTYGVSVEQILKVISDVPLLEDEAGLYMLVGPTGKDGVSPTIEVEETDEGVRVSVTDLQGTSSYELHNGKDGNDGAPGPAGKDGAKGEPGKDGKDGEKGKDGTDGFSPIVTVKSDTDDEYILSITDARGSFNTPNLKGKDGSGGAGEKGDKGDPGEKGEKGDKGDPGEDGYTPVKGVDYWTDEDQASIVNAVLEALPSAEEVGF